MDFETSDHLPSALTALVRDFTDALAGNTDFALIADSWELMATELERRRCNGELQFDLARQAFLVAHNMISQGSACLDLADELDETVEGIRTELVAVLQSHSGCEYWIQVMMGLTVLLQMPARNGPMHPPPILFPSDPAVPFPSPRASLPTPPPTPMTTVLLPPASPSPNPVPPLNPFHAHHPHPNPPQPTTSASGSSKTSPTPTQPHTRKKPSPPPQDVRDQKSIPT